MYGKTMDYVSIEKLKWRSRRSMLELDLYFERFINTGELAKLNEADFCKWLTTKVGVAAIPVSAFYDQPTESGVIRFCFAKQEQTLATALQRLQSL